MRACYFYFTVWPEAVLMLPPEAEQVWTGPQSEDYWYQFARRWTGDSDLVTIEQDVAVHPGVLPQFAACPEPWCAFGWQVGPGQHSTWWLGCTKFSAELQRAVPDSLLCRPHPPGICAQCTNVPCHRHLDVILAAVGEHLGYEKPHVHYPDIRHLRA